jgi:tryptophan-rich hypothetical protein
MKQQTTRLHPKKLVMSKWTATKPHNKEKHFIVIKVIEPKQPELQIETVELEAVYSRRSFIMSWRELIDSNQWLQGWQ